MHTPESIACLLDSRRGQRVLAKGVTETVDRATHYTLTACRQPTSTKDDLVQEILIRLFRDDAKLLRGWDPERSSFNGYLCMITGRFVRRRLGKGVVAASLADIGPTRDDGDDLDARLAYRAALDEVLAWVQTHGSDKDRQRFESLYVEQRAPADIAKQEGLSVDAIYAWKARLRDRLEKAMPHALELFRSTRATGGDDAVDEP